MSTTTATLKAELERQLVIALLEGVTKVQPKATGTHRPQASKGSRVQFGGVA